MRLPDNFRAAGVTFLCEQDGATERDLKARWLANPEFRTRVQQAYLVRVRYKGSEQEAVVLALAADSQDFRAAMRAAAADFSAMFNNTQSLDFLQLSDEQSAAVACVANSFVPPRSAGKAP